MVTTDVSRNIFITKTWHIFAKFRGEKTGKTRKMCHFGILTRQLKIYHQTTKWSLDKEFCGYDTNVNHVYWPTTPTINISHTDCHTIPNISISQIATLYQILTYPSLKVILIDKDHESDRYVYVRWHHLQFIISCITFTDKKNHTHTHNQNRSHFWYCACTTPQVKRSLLNFDFTCKQ